MSISLDTERKRKKPKNAVFAAHHVVASAGNTKVKIANDDGPAADSASVAERTGFIISSTSKTMIQSILTLFAVYDQISTQHKINSVDAVSHDIAASHVKLEFKLIKRGKGSGGGGYEVAIVQRNASSKAVTCASLRDFMEARTTAMSYQRVLRMAEMIYEQMTALEGLGLAPPYYGLDDILVINESFFCFINDAKLFAIGAGSDARRRRIDVTQAISRTAAFFAPELIGGISALPYSADVQSSYYSYGLLVAYCATFNSKLITTSHEKGQEGENERKEKDEEEAEEEEEKGGDEEIDQQSGGKRRRRNKHNRQQQGQHQDQEQDQNQDQKQDREKHQRQDQSDRVNTRNRQLNLTRALEPLQYTKLYWLILRCCDPDVSRRSIIYL